MSRRDVTDDLVTVNATFLAMGPQSFRVEDADGEKHWLPRRECTLDPARPDPQDNVTISLPEWLAVKEGLV